jgi:hypothetical protein
MTWRDDRFEKPEAPLPVVYDYEKFFEPIERGWVQRKGYRKFEPVGQVLIREDVWDYLLGLKFEPFWGESSRRKAHQDAAALVQYLVENPAKELRDCFKTENHFQERTSFFSSIFIPGEAGPSFSFYRTLLMQGMTDGTITPETALNIFREIGDVAHVNQVLYGLRRAWRPPPGKGSQDINWDLHEGFADRVAEIAKAAREAEEAENGEEADEEDET